MAADNQYTKTFQLLADLARSWSPVSVPAPKVYDGSLYHSINDFFHFFEKYCMAKYGDDQFSWLQVLPDFLEGQYKSIVNSFGISRFLEYGTVKACLVEDFNVPHENLTGVASNLETQLTVIEPPIMSVNAVRFPSSERKPRRVKCFRCGIFGHIRRKCKVNLGRRVVSKLHVPYKFDAGTQGSDLFRARNVVGISTEIQLSPNLEEIVNANVVEDSAPLMGNGLDWDVGHSDGDGLGDNPIASSELSVNQPPTFSNVLEMPVHAADNHLDWDVESIDDTVGISNYSLEESFEEDKLSMFNLDEVFKSEYSFEFDQEIECSKPEKVCKVQNFSSGFKSEVLLATIHRELLYGYRRPNISSVFSM